MASQSELLDVLAACLRHGYPLTVNLQWTDRVVPLTLFPAERLVHCPVSMPQFLEQPAQRVAGDAGRAGDAACARPS